MEREPLSRELVSCPEQDAGLVLITQGRGWGTDRDERGHREVNSFRALGAGWEGTGLPLVVCLLCTRFCAVHIR